MTQTERQLIEKLEEYMSYLIELIDSEDELSDKSFEERVNKEDEIAALKQQVEQEEKTVSDEEYEMTCMVCGNKWDG